MLSLRNLRSAVAELTDIRESDTDFAREAERVNFGNVLEYAQLALKDQIHETGAQVRAEIDEPEVRLPRKNLRSVLYNLLSNALKYRAPGRAPEILVRTAISGEDTLLSVSDNGRGIYAFVASYIDEAGVPRLKSAS
ncbi:sensor histidine kinase [Pontibacter sp. 172403-2]|uniref:ATP-binding protein n=1 Tax=Pontibacter rufus TaxID=2791028 RepID=UPI0018AFC77F|nr:ATP-binding protein [Pontibacter sp. 172403-2]MBF9255689.1 sensor histidine kinase [Pontibacter sp. 172403-2]